jgi:hypothetical protein
MIHCVVAAVMARMRKLHSREERERGDSPVPTSIIIAGLAVLAIAVVAWATARANGFMATAPTP